MAIPADNDNLSGTTVVAIDDDPDMLHIISTFLGRWGMRVLAFENGIDAITKIEKEQVDCILLDMNLAEEQGTDISEVMRTMPSLKETPIIFLSASDDQQSVLQALRSGANDYLRKPFHTEELIARIRAHSRLSQQRRQLDAQNQLLQKRNDEAIILNSRGVMLQEVIRQYTPRSTWQKADLAALGGMIEIPDEEVELTFLFLDIKSFTSFAEQNTAQQVIAALNQCFDPVTAIIDKYGGDIDKFIGDAIFAIFDESWPAVQAAWHIQRSMERVNAERKAMGWTELMVRVGLNRGTVVRGNVGGKTRRENTLIGDAVNVASRIEKACAPGAVLMAEVVYEDVSNHIQAGPRKLLKVKGKEAPLKVRYLENLAD